MLRSISILLHRALPCQAESGLTPYPALNTMEVWFSVARRRPFLLGISLAVGRLTLDQVAEVRILHPQPLRSTSMDPVQAASATLQQKTALGLRSRSLGPQHLRHVPSAVQHLQSHTLPPCIRPLTRYFNLFSSTIHSTCRETGANLQAPEQPQFFPQIRLSKRLAGKSPGGLG